MPRIKITVSRIKKPTKSVNKELQWLCQSLGMFNLRDKEKSCFRIFVELLKATKRNKPISSDELAYRLNLTRGTVVHHLNKLIKSGVVIVKDKGYVLRVKNLDALIRTLKKDINDTLAEVQDIAKSIDDALGM